MVCCLLRAQSEFSVWTTVLLPDGMWVCFTECSASFSKITYMMRHYSESIYTVEIINPQPRRLVYLIGKCCPTPCRWTLICLIFFSVRHGIFSVYLLLLLSPFPTSVARILDFQNVLSWASSGVIRSACISLRTQSIHLPLGLPLGLFPGTLMSTTALTLLFSSIVCICPYQHSVISLTFSCILVTPSSFLMSTLFTLSLSVTPLILRNILISVFSRICSSFFLTVQHTAPHRRAS